MLHTQTIDNLNALKLTAMAAMLEDQFTRQNTSFNDLSFEERLALLTDHEIMHRKNIKLRNNLRRSKLRQSASFEDIDFRRSRGLHKATFLAFTSCDWIRQHRNIFITGPCGVGKSFIANALGHKACLEGFSVSYTRSTRLLEDLAIAHGDGTFSKRLTALSKTHVLIIDDWGLKPLTEPQAHDLLEIIDDRHEQRSTIITSQLPIEHWHQYINHPTLADAILDRIVHNAHAITLKGDSFRKLKNQEGEKNNLQLTQS
jgi:DNA replication protein DnaC